MTSIRDYTLAQMADLAFQAAPASLPGGLAPLTAAQLGVVIDTAGESFANGVYASGNAAALVGSGILGGLNTLVVAFRGADDRQDSISTLQNPVVEYDRLAELVANVDRLAASGAYQQVAITGHSLGGSLAQIYMASHPAGTTPVNIIADTFGSPGALVADTSDPRITNFVVVDDPAVWLGENRESVGDAVAGSINPLARPVAEQIARTLPGLTVDDALNSIPSLTQNYENAGTTVNLPGKLGGTGPISSVTGLLQADPAQHAISLYIQEIGDAAFALPGRGDEPLFDPAWYLRVNGDVAAAGIDAQQHYDLHGWREGRDPTPFFDTQYYLANNPDVAAAGLDPFQHYGTHGWREGRDPNPYFDDGFYLANNPDVAAAGIDPLIHYIQYGWSEGRDPSAVFDTAGYLLANPDVAGAGVNPLRHYLEFGIAEGREIA
ncbi:alpha/beta hydrolase family protein [Roseicella aquatilis]|uniref:Fungal lipase-like domain-containing protein n=1 Tax=Roseicella aquatilis TaxID=2527868 RepID=A0A4R4D402_9PROT|nr:hypothetical protein [Roseicella aquatilis]TCZ54984.1 hypothetical protein EXY23_22540 [Roseicella aquatilis]